VSLYSLLETDLPTARDAWKMGSCIFLPLQWLHHKDLMNRTPDFPIIKLCLITPSSVSGVPTCYVFPFFALSIALSAVVFDRSCKVLDPSFVPPQVPCNQAWRSCNPIVWYGNTKTLSNNPFDCQLINVTRPPSLCPERTFLSSHANSGGFAVALLSCLTHTTQETVINRFDLHSPHSSHSIYR
jgi:hypothetical protein